MPYITFSPLDLGFVYNMKLQTEEETGTQVLLKQRTFVLVISFAEQKCAQAYFLNQC